MDLFWLLYGNNSNSVRETTATYNASARRVPVTGKVSGGSQRRPIAFLSTPATAQNSYALLVDNEDYSPRILAGEVVLVSADQAPQPGDEVVVQYRTGKIKLHTFLTIKKKCYVLDSIIGEKQIKNIEEKTIKSVHKILAVFRPDNIID